MNGINLQLNENYVTIDIDKQGYRQQKLIRYEDFAKGFAQTVSFDSGMLPGEYGVKYIKQMNNGSKKIIYVEPAHRIDYKFFSDDDIDRDEFYDEYGEFDEEAYNQEKEERYDKQDIFDSVTPILVWVIEFERNSTHPAVRLFAMKEPPVIGLEKVYRAPFGNIYGDTNYVCWGNENIYVPTLQSIHGISFTFFNDFENLDLVYNRIKHYTRENGFDADKPVHLHKENHELFKQGKTEEEILERVHNVMIPWSLDTDNSQVLIDDDAITFNELINQYI